MHWNKVGDWLLPGRERILGSDYFVPKAIAPVVKFKFTQHHVIRKIIPDGSNDMLILVRMSNYKKGFM
jgi:hypothetical protein